MKPNLPSLALFAALLASIAPWLASCSTWGMEGSGVPRTEEREVGAFDRIELSGSGRLEVTTGPLSALSVTADDNLLGLLRTEVVDGTLIIERTRPRAEGGGPAIEGRVLGQPQHFSLVKRGRACVLIHEESAKRWTLGGASCVTATPRGA